MRECTLRQRLIEMRQTPLANMSKTDFESVVVEPKQPACPIGGSDSLVCMPPCMRNSKRKEERAALLDKEMDMDRALGRALLDGKKLEAIKDWKASDRADMPPPKGGGRRKRRRAVADDNSEDLSTLAVNDKCDGENASGTPATPESVASSSSNLVAGDGALVLQDRARAEKFTKTDPSSDDILENAHCIASELQISGILEQLATGSGGGDVAASAAPAHAVARIDEIVASKPTSLVPIGVQEGSAGPGPAGNSPKPLEDMPTSRDGDSGEEEGLSDVDDEELDAYLLDNEERQDKSDIWHEVNKDYLEEWHVRGKESRRKKQSSASGSHHSQASASEAGDTASETGSHSRSSRRGSWRPRAASCTESAVMALTKTGKVSTNRINIEALNNLFS